MHDIFISIFICYFCPQIMGKISFSRQCWADNAAGVILTREGGKPCFKNNNVNN